MGLPAAINAAPNMIRADSVSIKTLLEGFSRIHVPVYQRDYAWTKEEVGELWSDVLPVVQRVQETYFIGSMVFVGAQGSDVEVVDGQQRLIWAMLLFCALRDGCKEQGDQERSDLINTTLVVSTDFETLQKQTRLMLNEHNNELYQQIALQEITLTEIRAKRRDRALSASNRLLASTYVQLHEAAADATNQFRDTEQLGRIQAAVAQRLNLIKIESTNDVSAYVLFETLNDRGLDLTLADLLKNYLFSRAGGRLEEVRSKWTEIAALVGKSNLTRFVRHEWMSRKGKIRERELYGLLKASLVNQAEVITYVAGLRAAADVYSALENSDDTLWQPLGETIRARLKQIKLLGVTQCYPLLLACKAVLSIPQFERVADWIVSLTVRYSIIGEKGTGNLETLYAKASMLVRAQPLRMSDVRNAFLELWPDDAEFRSAFIAKTMSSEPLIKYILQTLEQQANNAEGLVADLSALTVEHILPKSPAPEWPARLRRDPLHRDNVKRLGNLVLLSAADNEECGNRLFAEKRPILAASDLLLTSMAAEPDAWDENTINARQERMSDLALLAWTLVPNP